MRIFYITHTFSTAGLGGGGESFCYNFLNELKKRGHEIFVFTTSTRRNVEKEKELGWNVYSPRCYGTHALHKFQYVLHYRKAIKLAKKFKPDIIHAQNDVLPGIIAHKIKNSLGIPHVLAVEYLSSEVPSINLKLVFALNKFFLPRLNYDVLVSWSSYAVKKYLSKWKIPKKKIRVIPGGVDTNFFRPLPKKKLKGFKEKFGKRLIVSAKPLHRTNALGLIYVVDAMKTITKKFPEWKYVIFGDGPSKHLLEDRIAKNNLEENVVLAGYIDKAKMPAVWNIADIVVHSFAFEATTSIALIESMACGKAIVASNCGEIPYTINKAGVLAKFKNAKSFANSIARLIEQPRQRNLIARKALKRVRKEFSIVKVVDKFEQLYGELCNR